jgi:hypothetical protein
MSAPVLLRLTTLIVACRVDWSQNYPVVVSFNWNWKSNFETTGWNDDVSTHDDDDVYFILTPSPEQHKCVSVSFCPKYVKQCISSIQSSFGAAGRAVERDVLHKNLKQCEETRESRRCSLSAVFLCHLILNMNSVGIASRLQVGRSGFRLLEGMHGVCVVQIVRAGCGALQLLFSEQWRSCSGINQRGCEVIHWPSSGGEVRNEWSCTSVSLYGSYGADRRTFSVLLPRCVNTNS